DQLLKDLPQTGDRHGPPEAPMADGAVLTEHTPQIAPGEEHRAAAPGSTDAGFLPEVEGGPGHHRQRRHAAEAAPLCPGAQRAAPPGTEPAEKLRHSTTVTPAAMYWSCWPRSSFITSKGRWPVQWQV